MSSPTQPRVGSSTPSWSAALLLMAIACNGRHCGPDDTGQDCPESERRTWYTDADGDGYGDPLDFTEACSAPDDAVSNGDDCDDGAADRHDLVSRWQDADGDGYGVGSSAEVCEGEAGYAEQDGDCDDEDGDVYPGAPAVPDNGKDDNCDGLSDSEAPEGEESASDADIRVTGSAAGALGYAVYSAGDLNEDGWPDLAVGAPEEEGTGAAYLFYGPLDAGSLGVEDAGARFVAQGDGLAAGSAFIAGNLTDDDSPDLGVMCGEGSKLDGGSSLYILMGPAPETAILEPTDTVILLRGSGPDALTAGDFVSADGALDLVGSFAENDTIKLAKGPFSDSYEDDSDFYGVLKEELGVGYLGTAATFVGDMTGDGVTDLLVGSPLDIGTDPEGDYLGDVGVAWVIDDPQIIRQDDMSDITWSLYGPTEGSRFGESIEPAGDVNGDGYADFWIAAPGYASDSGVVYLFSGQDVSTADFPFGYPYSEALVTREGLSDGGRFGAKLAGNADANGDGVMDLAVAAPEADDGQGAVYLWYGAIASGSASRADLILSGGGSGDRFGASISLRDDMNLLGNVDLVVGAPGADDGDGAAYVFFMDGL